jgi:hypothetical protein
MSNMPSRKNDRSSAALILNGSKAMRLGAAAEEKLKDSTHDAKKQIKKERIMVYFVGFKAMTLLKFLFVVSCLLVVGCCLLSVGNRSQFVGWVKPAVCNQSCWVR